MDAMCAIAGRCSTVFEGSRNDTRHGHVLVVVKPDQTVLVHDADGYQPVAWLTRPESVRVTNDRIIAQDGDQFLEITIHDEHSRAQYPTSDAGTPIGDCPSCEATLVHARGSVSCPDCDTGYSLPHGATVLEESCFECDLPMITVERGRRFDLCLDPRCDPLDERVREAFDREWDCPDCAGTLRVLRRGGLLLGCDRYPECETSFSFPTGVVDGECNCGLPLFKIQSGQRCLDSTCDGTTQNQSSLPAAGT